MAKFYKYLHLENGKIVSSRQNFKWEIGKEYSAQGDIKACSNGFHASVKPLDALSYVKGNVLAIVEASGDCDNESDKVCYRTMKIVKAYKWTANDSVALAIYSAEQVIKIYEDKYPNDSRPRDAIKAAKAYLKDPSKKNANAADAANAARAAARAAAYAARAAAYAAADAAARAARAAAYAAADAAADAANAAADAANAAADAANATDAELTTKINRWIKSRVKKLEGIK